MLCRPIKLSKHNKLCASQSARSSLAPAGLRGARGAEPLASGNGKATIRAIYLGEQFSRRKEDKTLDQSKTKKAVKRHRFSGKQRRGQAPALHVWSTDPKSGQFAKKRAYSFPANTAPRVRATNCPRPPARQLCWR